MIEPSFESITEGIYRLCIPFERIYTTVFALVNGKQCILIDCGSTDADVEAYLLPALGKEAWEVCGIFCSHAHSDHDGGMARLSVCYPGCILSPGEGDCLLERFRVVRLSGHAPDCIGVWDPKTHTLIACDAVQQRSIDRFPVLVSDPAAYRNSLERIRALAPQRLLCSHDYDPFGWCVERENVEKCLALCEKAIP